MKYNDSPSPDNLRLLANDPTFPNPGFWHDRLHAAADAWERDVAMGRALVEGLTEKVVGYRTRLEAAEKLAILARALAEDEHLTRAERIQWYDNVAALAGEK